MISFKQFLQEVENITYSDTKEPIHAHIKNEDDLKEYGADHISTTDSGHKIYKYRFEGESSYHAVNPTTKNVDISIKAKEKDNTLHKPLVLANDGNTLKAHDFLHHLINKHNKTMVIDKMSAGGKKVFQKLERIHGNDVKFNGLHRGKEVAGGPHDDHMYADKDGDKTAKNTYLVASKK